MTPALIYTLLFGVVFGCVDGASEGSVINARTLRNALPISALTHAFLLGGRALTCLIVSGLLFPSAWYALLMLICWDLFMRPVMNYTRHRKFPTIEVYHMGHGLFDSLWRDIAWIFTAKDELVAFCGVSLCEIAGAAWTIHHLLK